MHGAAGGVDARVGRGEEPRGDEGVVEEVGGNSSEWILSFAGRSINMSTGRAAVCRGACITRGRGDATVGEGRVECQPGDGSSDEASCGGDSDVRR